jgi:hypothetical protein
MEYGMVKRSVLRAPASAARKIAEAPVMDK